MVAAEDAADFRGPGIWKWAMKVSVRECLYFLTEGSLQALFLLWREASV